MPYPGVPPSKTQTMDRCVQRVMGQGKDKSSAIAICHTSIMGNKKMDQLPNLTFNINLNDYWKNKNADEIAEEILPVVEEQIKEEGGEKKEMKKDEIKKDDEEVKDEPVAEGESETPASEDGGDQPAEEVVADDSAKEVVEETTPADVEEAVKVSDLIKQVIEKIDKVHEAVTKQDDGDDSAPAEGAASEEEAAPEGGEGEAPAEEGAQDAPTEGAEDNGEVAKSLSKVADSMEKLAKSVGDVSTKVSDIDKRLTKIEEQPAPSKIVSPVVVSKNGNSENVDDSRLTEIKKELDALEELKKSNLEQYQRGKSWEKAFSLIAERDQILAISQ